MIIEIDIFYFLYIIYTSSVSSYATIIKKKHFLTENSMSRVFQKSQGKSQNNTMHKSSYKIKVNIKIIKQDFRLFIYKLQYYA